MASRPASLLAWSIVFGAAVAQYNPLNDFCRRWGHQAAIVDRRLYIDGGLVNWKPFTAASQNMSNTFLAYNDLDSASPLGMPQLHADLSKNATIPDVNGGILWEDSVNKRLYLYGGEYFQTSPTSFVLYSYDILNNYWVSFGPPGGTSTINAVSYGAGVSISSRGEAYYYGGWLSNASVPGWSGPPVATNRMVKYVMDSNSWSNITGPDDVRRGEGAMVFIPISDAGMLVYFGGSQDLYGNGTITPQPLDTIFIYDIASSKWYKQKTSGRTPEIRRRFCAGATWAQDQSSYNIYIYGGAGFPPDTTGYDDVYILSIPSFQWIRGPYPTNSNVTGPYPKSMMSCNVVDNAQMLVIGGTYSNDTTYMCDADTVWGTHNMDLGEQNSDNAIWAKYQPQLTTYAVPTDILTAVGGRNTGAASKTTPVSGFDAPDLSVLMTRKAAAATRTPTRRVDMDTPTPTASPTGLDGGGSVPLSTGAIAGIAVAGAAVFLAVLAGCVMYIHRRPRHLRGGDRRPLGPPVPVMAGQYGSGGSQDAMQGLSPRWAASTQVSSPTLTAASGGRSYSGHPYGGPPAELATETGPDGYRSMSPNSTKFGSNAQQSAELASNTTPGPEAMAAYPSPTASGPFETATLVSPATQGPPAAEANFNPGQDVGWDDWSHNGHGSHK